MDSPFKEFTELELKTLKFLVWCIVDYAESDRAAGFIEDDDVAQYGRCLEIASIMTRDAHEQIPTVTLTEEIPEED